MIKNLLSALKFFVLVPLKDSSEKIMLDEYFFRYEFDSEDEILVYVTEEGDDVELVFETHLVKNKNKILVKDAIEEPINQFKAIFTFSWLMSEFLNWNFERSFR